MKNVVQGFQIGLIFVHHCISQHVERTCVKGKLTIVNMSAIKINQQASCYEASVLAVISGQVWASTFLAGRSTDKLDSLCKDFST
jgi:hypothetical protein